MVSLVNLLQANRSILSTTLPGAGFCCVPWFLRLISEVQLLVVRAQHTCTTILFAWQILTRVQMSSRKCKIKRKSLRLSMLLEVFGLGFKGRMDLQVVMVTSRFLITEARD